MDSLVSIIIPSFNSAHLIIETLESIYAQKYSNWECIIIDDGSTDNTEAIVSQWIAKDQRFTYIKISNRGASNARNVGFSIANGDYIQFLDADDVLHPQKLEKQLQFMLDNNLQLSFVQWDYFKIELPVNPTFRFNHIKCDKFNTGQDVLFSFGMENWFILIHAWLCKRELLDEVEGWNVSLSNNDDGEYFARVLMKTDSLGAIHEILAFCRINETDSLSKLNSISKIDSAYTSYGLIEELIRKTGQLDLLAYPKRLYYMQFSSLKNDFPKLARRAAKGFDCINADCFLSKRKKYWKIISFIGLYNGEIVYRKLLKWYSIVK